MDRPVSELFDQYLACSQLAESSKDIKKRICRYFVEVFGDIAAGQVDYAVAEDFRNWLAGRTERAVNSYIRNFRPFWAWLVKRRIIETNPFEHIRDLTIENYQGAIFKPDEIERMIRLADLHWQVFIVLGLVGLRRGEALNLTRDDIDFEHKYIHVRGKEDTESTWRWRIKNNVRRIVPLPEAIQLPDMIVPVHRLINELTDELLLSQPYVCVKPKDYVSCLQLKNECRLSYGKRVCPWGNFSRDFRRLQRRANIRPVKPFRDLRATFGTKLSETMSLTDTQKLMGHKSPQTTAMYYVRREGIELVQTANNIVASKFAE